MALIFMSCYPVGKGNKAARDLNWPLTPSAKLKNAYPSCTPAPPYFFMSGV